MRTRISLGTCVWAVSLGLLSLATAGCGGSSTPITQSNPFQAANQGNAPAAAAPIAATAPQNPPAANSAGSPSGGGMNAGSPSTTDPGDPNAPSMSPAEKTAELASIGDNPAPGTATPPPTRTAPVENLWTGEPGNWSQFRGPNGSGISPERNLPVTWSYTNNVAWKVPLNGKGASSPIIHGDKVFVTTYRGYGQDESNPGQLRNLTRRILCVHRDSGRTLWDYDVPQKNTPDRPYQGYLALHGYASSTPATDGERVYAFFGNLGLFAIEWDEATKKRSLAWTQGVGTETHDWGSGSSPILFENLVIVNASVESGEIGAVDRKDGRVVWHTSGFRQTWGTPVIVDVPGGQPELVLSMEGRIVGLDPRTGNELWHCNGIPDYVCPSVVARNGIVYAIGGRSATAVAVRAGGQGDVTDSHVLWTVRKGSNVPSPVLIGKHLYWVNDQGIAVCLDADTGEVVTEKRLGTGQVFASVVAGDEKLYVVSRDRGIFVLTATPEMEELAQNRMDPDDSIANASIAISQGRLYLRTDRFLYCIEN